MRYLLFALIVIAILLAYELLVYIVLETIRKKSKLKTFRIKMVKTGNKDFYLKTIHDVRGIDSFHELQGQIYVFRDLTRTIVTKILQFQLEDYFTTEDMLQAEIDAFCKRLEQFGDFLQIADFNDSTDEGKDKELVHLAAKEVIERNRSIVKFFLNVDQDLNDAIVNSA
ncbi:hypothetical protein IIW29_01340 [Candidatus Saccharibacteria bacterium]|nr:hypothetical protein [Candidatus Saccharibacteria bacterium]